MYKDGLEKDLTAKKCFVKLMPVLVILIVVLTGVVYALGARSFWRGFGYTIVIWFILELCVTVGFGCGWYTHVKQVQSVDIEWRTNTYQSFLFYIKGMLEGMAAGVLVSALIGWMIHFLV